MRCQWITRATILIQGPSCRKPRHGPTRIGTHAQKNVSPASKDINEVRWTLCVFSSPHFPPTRNAYTRSRPNVPMCPTVPGSVMRLWSFSFSRFFFSFFFFENALPIFWNLHKRHSREDKSRARVRERARERGERETAGGNGDETPRNLKGQEEILARARTRRL
jgi:hypothetical protein